MLDEPAAELSANERSRLVDLLTALPRSQTLLMIEHDIDIALKIADRITVMHQGRVIAEGAPAEVGANRLVLDMYLGRHAN